MRLQKILVIGSKTPRSLNELLHATDSRVTQVADGQTAVSRAQCEMFHAAILISTGEEMDLAETLFNLRDISGSMELIILSDQSDAAKSAVPMETLVSLVPKASVMTTRELMKRLNAP